MLKFSFSDCKVTVFQRDTEILLHFFFIFCIFPSLWTIFLPLFHQKSPICLVIWYAEKDEPRFMFHAFHLHFHLPTCLTLRLNSPPKFLRPFGSKRQSRARRDQG